MSILTGWPPVPGAQERIADIQSGRQERRGEIQMRSRKWTKQRRIGLGGTHRRRFVIKGPFRLHDSTM